MFKIIGFAAEMLAGTTAGKIAELAGASPATQKGVKLAAEWAVRKFLPKN